MDMFKVSGFMYMSDPPHGMLILDLQAGGNPISGTGITPPILTKTSSSGASPITFSANFPDTTISAGMYAHLTVASDSAFTSVLREETIQMDLDWWNNLHIFSSYFTAITFTGPVYIRLEIQSDEPRSSGYSGTTPYITDTLPVVLGFVSTASRIDRTALATTGDRWTGVTFGAGRPVFTIIRKGVLTSCTINGVAATKKVSTTNVLAGDGFTQEESTWIAGADVAAASTHVVDTVASVTNNDAVLYPATATAITQVGATVSKHDRAFFNTGNSVTGDAALTVGAGELGVAYLLNSAGTTYTTAMTTERIFGGGDAGRWVTFTASQTPAFTTDAFSVCAILAVVLKP